MAYLALAQIKPNPPNAIVRNAIKNILPADDLSMLHNLRFLRCLFAFELFYRRAANCLLKPLSSIFLRKLWS